MHDLTLCGQVSSTHLPPSMCLLPPRPWHLGTKPTTCLLAASEFHILFLTLVKNQVGSCDKDNDQL